MIGVKVHEEEGEVKDCLRLSVSLVYDSQRAEHHILGGEYEVHWQENPLTLVYHVHGLLTHKCGVLPFRLASPSFECLSIPFHRPR
jgi:hypothetical protein